MTDLCRREIREGVNFRSLRSDRYKTMLISANFFLPLNAESASANAILPFLLSRASRRYPDYTLLNQRLAELYGAELGADVRKCGDMQVVSVSVSAIADRYALEGEKISAELSDLLCSACFDPPLQNGVFPREGFLQEQRQLLETLDSEFNDKIVYALRRCEEIMCAGEPFGLGRLGTRESISALTPASAAKAWAEMIRGANAEILVLGDCDPEPVFQKFSAAFRPLERTAGGPYVLSAPKRAGKTKRVAETEDVAQSKLVMGFRAACAEPQAGVPAMKLMSALYGGMPTSRLFQNVREKKSLCYYCSSSYNAVKGILEVQSGVERENIAAAEEEILAQLEAVRRGEFSDADVADAKRYLANVYGSFSDSIDALEGWYLAKSLTDPTRSPEDEAAMVAAVGREAIIEAARSAALDTVYRLEGNGGDA
jgi:predicted Zn-dependent peptidase